MDVVSLKKKSEKIKEDKAKAEALLRELSLQEKEADEQLSLVEVRGLYKEAFGLSKLFTTGPVTQALREKVQKGYVPNEEEILDSIAEAIGGSGSLIK